MKKNSEQPAFPVTPQKLSTSLLIGNGLTKREYFAGLAMQAAISCGSQTWLSMSREDMVKQCLYNADCLLKQLEEKETSTNKS